MVDLTLTESSCLAMAAWNALDYPNSRVIRISPPAIAAFIRHQGQPTKTNLRIFIGYVESTLPSGHVPAVKTTASLDRKPMCQEQDGKSPRLTVRSKIKLDRHETSSETSWGLDRKLSTVMQLLIPLTMHSVTRLRVLRQDSLARRCTAQVLTEPHLPKDQGIATEKNVVGAAETQKHYFFPNM